MKGDMCRKIMLFFEIVWVKIPGKLSFGIIDFTRFCSPTSEIIPSQPRFRSKG